jgi:hypothetical protein
VRGECRKGVTAASAGHRNGISERCGGRFGEIQPFIVNGAMQARLIAGTPPVIPFECGPRT